MSTILKDLGVALGDVKLVEEYYHKLKGVFVHSFSNSTRGVVLDLNSIPPDYKTAVIKWIISVNLQRLQAQQEPIVTLDLVLKCPVWKVLRPPLQKLGLTQEQMFNSPKAAHPTFNRRSKVRGINR